MSNTNTKKLSAYTIASNCTDISDIDAGINELKQYFNACEKENKKPSNTAYVRLSKLSLKRDKLQKRK